MPLKRNKPLKNPTKKSVYLPKEMIEEIRTEGLRMDRTISWMIQRAWKLSKTKKIPKKL
jgi:uncharacterized small protein (TIGR04563 family)